MAPGLSRSLGGEVQLGRCKRDIEVNRKKCAPHTPPVDYTCKNHLLRVVSDVGPKEVSLGARMYLSRVYMVITL